MKKIRNIFCLLLLAFLAGCGKQREMPEREEARDFTQGFLPAGERGKFVKVDENERFILYADFGNGEAAVEDKKEGYTWYTNPPDKQSDGLASGFNKNALLSVLTVNYSTDRSVNMSCGGYMSCVTKDGLSYRLEEDGSVIFLFDFPNEEFRIPLRYAIEEDRFVVQLLTDGIEEYGTNTIIGVDVLPFFGAGGRESEGYLVVPDGSGALIYYNNNKTVANSYSKALFGFDNGTNDKVMGGAAAAAFTTVSENQYLSVFGVHQDNRGFLAVITGGEGRTTIKANVAGKYTLYNTVWGSYAYRTVGTVRQVQKDGSDMAVSISEKNLESWEDYEVSFYFLEEGRASYADMAACYRDYLVGEGKLAARVPEREDIPLYLELYGYMVKTKSFLGIPKDMKISLTTVEDANRMLDALQGNGINNVVLKYNYCMKNSFYSKIPISATSERKVGSKNELLGLQQRLEDAGGELYLSADLMNVYKTGKGVSKYNDVLQSVANTVQLQYKFVLGSAVTDSRYDPWYLLKPASLEEFFGKLAANMEKSGYHNLGLDSIGQMCYSELSSNGMGRNQVTDVLEEVVAKTKESVDHILLTGANGYAAMQADHILKTSVKCSNYDIEDVSIPFYQMVFHGLVSYSLDPVNLSSNSADLALKHMEYGAYPLYSLVGENIDELIGSRIDGLYSADFEEWEAYIGQQYAVLNQVLGKVQASVITGHEIISEDVRKVRYANGVVIYVNYGNAAASADGHTIEGKGYLAEQDGVILAQGRADDMEGGGD